MDVGIMMIFAAYGWDDIADDRVWGEELRRARIAAESGFDLVRSAEASLKLFAKEVLPVPQSWKQGATHSMAAQ